MAAAKENGRGGSASPRAGGGGEDEAGDADHADARQDVGGKSEELEKRNENHESRMQRKQMQDQM